MFVYVIVCVSVPIDGSNISYRQSENDQRHTHTLDANDLLLFTLMLLLDAVLTMQYNCIEHRSMEDCQSP